jgi:uncharacterized membrane protein YgcG
MKNFIYACGLIFLLACQNGRYDQNDSVPKGDPPFTPLSNSWVIDKAGVLSPDSREKCHLVCQRMQTEGLAEVVVLIQTGINNPVEYSTHYGRWLGLGRKGLSTAGGNNGIVWLIRPDARRRITVSVGRGLPEFTSVDYGKIMMAAKDYINFDDFDTGIEKIVDGTYQKLLEIKQSKKSVP